MATNGPLSFYLSELDSSFNVLKGTISTTSISNDTLILPKGIAELYVDASAVRNVFQFQSSSSGSMDDISNSDMQFFVDASGFANLPCNTQGFEVNSVAGTTEGPLRFVIGQSYVSGTRYQEDNEGNDYKVDSTNTTYSVDNKSLIKDLFRDLAHQLFKTQYAVDIFQNETDLCNNTASSLEALFFNSSEEPYNIFWRLSLANGLYINTDTSGNIGKLLFESIASNDPIRLTDLSSSTYEISGGDEGRFKMPLLAGDKIQFHIECIFDEDQNDIIGDDSLTINPRRYEIVLNLQ
jgi:hypothetical protein